MALPAMDHLTSVSYGPTCHSLPDHQLEEDGIVPTIDRSKERAFTNLERLIHYNDGRTFKSKPHLFNHKVTI